MRYGFDSFGWFTGLVPDADPRSTAAAPANTSTSATPGQLRANWAGSAWVDAAYVAPGTVDVHAQRRLELVEAIKAERDRRKGNGVLVGSVWFQTDNESRAQQLKLYVDARNNTAIPAIPWKVKGGAFVTMTAALAIQIADASQAADIAIFGLAEQLIAQVMAAPDPAAINIMAGWPATFGEV